MPLSLLDINFSSDSPHGPFPHKKISETRFPRESDVSQGTTARHRAPHSKGAIDRRNVRRFDPVFLFGVFLDLMI